MPSFAGRISEARIPPLERPLLADFPNSNLLKIYHSFRSEFIVKPTQGNSHNSLLTREFCKQAMGTIVGRFSTSRQGEEETED